MHHRRMTVAAVSAAALAMSTLAVVTPAQAQENLIVNGDFSDGVEPWTATDGVTLGVTDGQLCADIPGGTDWTAAFQITQADLALEGGENYALTFSASASRTLYTQPVVRSAQSPDPADLAERIQLTPEPQTFEFLLTASASVTDGSFYINAGGHQEPWTLCLDDVSLTAGADDPGPDRGAPSFVEEFDNGIDDVFWYTADGFNNGDWTNCQFNAANATTANGILTLSLDDTAYGDRDYSCATVQTHERYSYGTYETRMKAGNASGTNSSLFTYIGPFHGEPHDEIDFEVLGKDPTSVDLNTWVSGSPKGPGAVDIGYDSSAEWVDFAFIWEPHQIRFYINDELMHTVTDITKIPTHDQIVHNQIWGTDTLTDWMGPFEYPGSPITAEYEYTAFTRAGDECQFATSVACDVDVPPVTDSFVDDFDTFNGARWQKSDGWNSGAKQNCTWDADQATVTDGVLDLTFVAQPTGDRDYACAEIQHNKKLGYGTYEARVKGIDNSGVMATFFTWVGGDPTQAIDIAKLLGVDTSAVKVNTWENDQPLAPAFIDLASPADQEFHDYGVVWSATQLDFYVDGVLAHSITEPAKIPDKPTNMFFSIWGSGTTPQMGDFVPPTGPLTMQVDRVAYTAPGDGCQFDGSIACDNSATGNL